MGNKLSKKSLRYIQRERKRKNERQDTRIYVKSERGRERKIKFSN